MAKTTIVVADNNRDFLDELGDFLKQGGYSVILAGSIEEAKRVLQKKKYDLVILDVRLTDDNDVNDHSGLRLAETISPDIPKIILTRKPNYNVVREALGPGVKGFPAAVDFVTKEEMQERLLPALEDAIFVKALQSGDDIAWERFWKTEAWSLIALCRRHGISPEDAVRICMEIFGELARLIKRPLKQATLRAQLVSKAFQKINQSQPRRGKPKSGTAPAANVTGELLANEELLRDITAAVAEEEISRDEMIEQLTNAIEELPPQQQKVITLRLFRAMPTPAIAKKMRITEKTVFKHMEQGFRHLRSKVAEIGGS